METFVILFVFVFLKLTDTAVVQQFLSDNNIENINSTQNISISAELLSSSHVRYRDQETGNEDRYIEKPLYDLRLDYCKKSSKCQPLNYTTCLGVKLPYHFTTLELTNYKNQEKIQERLALFTYFRYVPKCWAVIQPFLCSLYMPKCENDLVDLPSREMCKITLEPCKIFYKSAIFSEFFNCDNEELFPSHCKNDVHELKFNTTGYCIDHFVKTDKSDWFYPGVEGCSLKCKDALYSETEQIQIHNMIAYCVLACLLSTLFTILTFVIDWKTANKYPALSIFYVNVCFFISYSGWLIQFLGSETREDIVCKKDGTLRKSEPSASENLSCVVVFVMVYYFLIAGMVWFVIFSYSWHMTSMQALGKSQERVDKKRAYFHLVAWSLPLVMTITTMALGEIDADYVTGICFVGFQNMPARIGLLLTPLAAAMISGGYIILKGLVLLVKVKNQSREIISEHSSSKIRSNIVRMGVFFLFMVVFCIISFVYHGYIFLNRGKWMDSLNSLIVCRLTSLSADFSHCQQNSRPSVAMLQLQLLAVFGAGIGMAQWVWCEPTLHAWARYLRRKFHCEIDEPLKLQKHKIIAQAFAKRYKFNEGDKISIDCQNHSDPVGLHFDLNSAASNELSTTWAANLPRLVNRRGAKPDIYEVKYSVSSNNQSIDSAVSLNLRHVSIESRRNSGDSQLSVQIAELKATRKVKSGRHRNSLPHKRYYRKRSRLLSKSCPKKDSNTSLDSHLQLINALTNGGDGKNLGPNLNRRAANAGLDHQHINNLLTNGKLVIPYNRKNKSESEEENVSVTISESKFNMVLSQHSNNLDLNDQLVIQSLRQGLKIQDIDSSSDSDASKFTEDKDYGQEKRFSVGRESKGSRRSRHSRRRKYSSVDSVVEDGGNSSCPEIKQLVHSSINSGVSTGGEKEKANHSSRQSRTSIDVAVQTNSQDIEMENLAERRKDKLNKSKKVKTKENKKKYQRSSKLYKDKDKSKFRVPKEQYTECGTSEECSALRRRDSNKYADSSDGSDKYSLVDEGIRTKVKRSACVKY